MTRCLQIIESRLALRSNRSGVSSSLPVVKLTVLEGQWQHPGTVIIEFPSREVAEGWYKSADYQAIIDLRLKSTSGTLVILDGI